MPEAWLRASVTLELWLVDPGKVHPGLLDGIMEPGWMGLGLGALGTVHLGPVVNPK